MIRGYYMTAQRYKVSLSVDKYFHNTYQQHFWPFSEDS